MVWPDSLLIEEKFLLRNDPVFLAKHLVGCYLATSIDGAHCLSRIVETEAYKAPEDKACHAYKNRKTKRTETMFLEGGHAYIYLCYGIHSLFNIVTGEKDLAHAVLIRAVEPIDGLATMQERRKGRPQLQWTNGPGKVSQALGISTQLNGIHLLKENSPVRLYQATSSQPLQIACKPRIGIDYAEECKHWLWRFYDSQSKYVSVR